MTINSEHSNKPINNKKEYGHLEQLGWSSFFQNQLDDDNNLLPARIIGVRRNSFLVHTGSDELSATVSGKIRNSPELLHPAIGDWVLLKETSIAKVLDRRNGLSRKASGGKKNKDGEITADNQVIAANLDTVFIVCGLDRDFNLRRIERYLTLIYNCGINPEIILTKGDLHPEPKQFVDEAEAIAFGTPVHLVSTGDDSVITELRAALPVGKTTALIGSSGAGKSTLINRLFGEDIRMTSSVSEQLGKGRHTTTTRDLILLPSMGMVIDNPGIREIGLVESESQAESAFPDIEIHARDCRFSDCSHTHEPGCKVLEAVSTGKLDPSRLTSYHKIRGELTYLNDRDNEGSARAERKRWKGVAKKIKAIKKKK